MEGYHRLSFCPSTHRQPGTCCNSVQTGTPKAPLTHNTRPAFLCNNDADREEFIGECASFRVRVGAAIALSRKIDPHGEGHYFTSVPIYCEPYMCRDGIERQPPAGEVWLLSAPRPEA